MAGFYPESQVTGYGMWCDEMKMTYGHKGIIHLKVPKCEIFDRSDFPDFYTIKSRREGDFGVKIKKL
jgi:hypothetical protein